MGLELFSGSFHIWLYVLVCRYGVGKSIATLRNAALIAPIMFYLLLFFEMLVMYFFSDSLTNFTQELLEIAALLGVVSLFFGYLCIGIAFALFKIMQIKKGDRAGRGSNPRSLSDGNRSRATRIIDTAVIFPA